MTTWHPDPNVLRGRIAVVAGATRGAGRGIAAALGEAGVTVICTGRSSRSRIRKSDYDRPETIEDTADLQRSRTPPSWSHRWAATAFPSSSTISTSAR
jgi:NAD(P)-dependent dehydrogenase (short-subunit alcohol dehydrogenase family)